MKQPSKQYGNLKLIPQKHTETVSSFFNYIFVGDSYNSENDDYLNIIKHEKVHSDEYHSLDILIVELLICVLWFNPFLWLYKKAIIQNHEYIADDKSIASGVSIETYANTIINLGQKEYRVPLTSGFNFIQIKNRIMMLHQSKSSLLSRTLNITLTCLLFAIIFTISSCSNLDSSLSDDPLVVVIDAGHGGNDPGQLSGAIQEKDIVLNISNYLKAISGDKIEIITTRDTDDFTTIENRIAFINSQKPDLVISLHCNAHTDNQVSGVEAYYYESEDENRLSKSREYSSGLTVSLVNRIFNRAKIKSSNFKILKDVQSPAILLELGFLTNENDLSQLIDTTKQQEIAESILEGIMRIETLK